MIEWFTYKALTHLWSFCQTIAQAEQSCNYLETLEDEFVISYN